MEYRYRKKPKLSINSPPGGHVSAQSNPDLRQEQSSGHIPEPEQAALLPRPSRRSNRLKDKLKWGSQSIPPPSPMVESRSNTPDTTTASQSQANSATLLAQPRIPSGGVHESPSFGSTLPLIQISYSQLEPTPRENPDDRISQLLTMLSPLEPLKRHQDVKLPRAKNTGTWLLSLESFCEWRDYNSGEEGGYVFCCYGIPGAGKSVICSTVIDELLNIGSDRGVACLYADYRDQSSQSLVHILGSFLCQFLTTPHPIPEEVIQKLDKIRHYRKKIETEDIVPMLRIRLQQFKRAFICIDAIDELEPQVLRQLLNVLNDMVMVTNNTRLFLTGRGHIEGEVQKHLVVQRYKVIISAHQEDVEEFVQQQIIDDPNPDAMDEVLAKDVVDAILKKSQGMFLLPALHIKTILGMPTKHQRRQVLEALPTNLYDSFRGITTRIRECPNVCQAELGMQVLMWLHFAYQPLKLKELQHALAVERSHTEFQVDNIPPRKQILDCCLGLVVVDDETLTVRFMHYTLEEYFQDNSSAEFPTGCIPIAETCLTYINFGKLRQHCTTLDSLRENIENYVFLKYAARYWGTYAKQQCNERLLELVQMVVNHESERPPCAIQALYLEINWHLSHDQLFSVLRDIPQRFSGVHALAYFGLSESMAYFYKLEQHVNLRDDTGRTPLSWAAGYGHESMVQLLIGRTDVNINSLDVDGRTPLAWASRYGRNAVVRLLIQSPDVGVNVTCTWSICCTSNVTGRRPSHINTGGWTPLMFAAEKGHETVVRLLIQRSDVNIGVTDGTRRTALSLAAEKGHEAVVRLLVGRHSVDINAKDHIGRTALSLAAANGSEAVVQLLIERGSDINAISKKRWTPLMYAAERGHEPVVQLLIERAAVDIGVKDDKGRTCVSLAAEEGHEAIVRLLIEKNDDIDADDYLGRTPLMYAAGKGHEAVVRLLLEGGDADINAKSKRTRTASELTPLTCAAQNGHEAVVRLLIERNDIDIDVKDENGWTPLSWAAWKGHETVVRLLIERNDVDIDVKDNGGETPLSLAARNGHEAVVRLLVERGDVDINAKSTRKKGPFGTREGLTPLMYAAGNGHEAVVRLLIQRNDVRVNIQDKGGRTALMYAAERGWGDVVQLLIKRDDTDVKIQDKDGRTALMYAVGKAREIMLRGC